ncbi:hypothetical protein EC973_000311 [Apophysomyces ossiformis]|uniref:ER transporter 6TM N-terminal domain-containing protein n=1 Tax=Apophysomyces ossiformis TaxID=679940 RepID=A0A8H7BLI0_9FUNG|nr:hypothetical protein EC973_000311 [Apophysomyces ossiformis]
MDTHPSAGRIVPKFTVGGGDDRTEEINFEDDGETEETTCEKTRSSEALSEHVRFPTQLEHLFIPPPVDPRKAAFGEIQAEEAKRSKPFTERVLNYLHKKFPSRIVRRVLKCTIAYFVTTLFSLIPSLTAAIGPAAFLVTTGMLFNHPGRTMGSMWDCALTSVLGVVLAVLYTFAALAASSGYNIRHLDSFESEPTGNALNAAFLFVGVFGAQMLRQIYPKFYFFSLKFMMVLIFCLTKGVGLVAVPYNLPLQYGIPLIIGAGISFMVNLVIWPETAVDGLGRALQETVQNSKEMLHTMAKQFFLDLNEDMESVNVVDELGAKTRAGMIKVKSAYKEAKYEVSIAYIRPQELGDIRKSLDKVVKHLNILGGCLNDERQLFESVLEYLEEEEAEEAEYEQNPTTHSGETTPQRVRSDLEMKIREIAMQAALSSGKSRSPHPSRPNSRTTSRRTSIDEDYEDIHQMTVNSTRSAKSAKSVRSFFSNPRKSIEMPQPPAKEKKKLQPEDRKLLITYLESMRDPLMQLTIVCTDVLDCVSQRICHELDIEDDSDQSIGKTWWSYLRHILKLDRKAQQEEKKSTLAKPIHDPHTCNCSESVLQAINEFDAAEKDRMDSLYHLYRSRDSQFPIDFSKRSNVSLIFFFTFTLHELSHEVYNMAIGMDKLQKNSKERSRNGKRRKHLYMPQLDQKWWRRWASWNNHQSTRDKGGYSLTSLTRYIPDNTRSNDAQDEYRLAKIQTNVNLSRRRSSTLTKLDTRLSKLDTYNSGNHTNDATLRRRFTQPLAAVKEDLESSPEEDLTAVTLPLVLRIRYSIWRQFQYMKNYEFKFALKMAVAVMILSVPAFIPSSMTWFNSVRGQWAAMTVIAIMNPTSGGTLHASLWRIVGTLIGALVGWGALEAGGGSPYLLAAFAVMLAVPFFYIHLASTYNKVAIVVLISYMVVALSRMVWPFVARHATRKTISAIINELGEYYTYLTSNFLYHDINMPPSEEDIKTAEKMERKIQSSIDASFVLLQLTEHEPRLKAPFLKSFYGSMIVSLRNLLDRLMSMRTALTKMPLEVKQDICRPEYYVLRRKMISALTVHFYILSSSLKAKSSFPIYMPSAAEAREELLKSAEKQPDHEKWIRFRSLAWFALACSTQEIIDELDHLTTLIRYIVGDNRYADRVQWLDAIMIPNLKTKQT